MGTQEYNGYTIKLEQDECQSSSRDWDNLGTMICFHNRYALGDKHNLKSSDFENWTDLKKYIVKEHNPAVILPLSLYDHSGLSMKVGSFNGLLSEGHVQYDTMMVGYIFISKKKAREEYGWKNITKARKKKLAEYLTNEIEVYDQELSGDVWYYVITRDEDPDFHESLGGLYGFEYAESEAQGLVDGEVEAELLNCGEQEELALAV